MRITGYFFGKRTEYASLEEAWTCGSQLVRIVRKEKSLNYADISNDDKFDEWVKNGLDAGIFQVLN